MRLDKSNEAFIELLQSTTIHGLNHVYTAKIKSSKILWLFIFILGIAGFFFNLVFIMKKYLSNPILVSHFVDKENFSWPDLTFCNPTAPFDLESNPEALEHWTETFNNSVGIVNILKESRFFNKVNKFDNDETDLTEKAVILSSIDPHKVQIANHKTHIMFHGFTQSHPEIYLVKEYSHYATDIVQNDSQELFTTKYVIIRNNIPCFTFQIEKSKIIKFNHLSSLLFYINLNLDSYKIFNTSYIPRSVFLYMTYKDYLPQSDNIIITPGFNHEITITQVRYSRQGLKNVCRSKPYKIELYDTLLQTTYAYEGSYDDCRKVISQELYIETCQCYSPFLPIFKSSMKIPKLCFNISVFDNNQILQNADCMFEVYKNYSTNSTFKEIEKAKCQRYQDMKCDNVIYNSQSRKDIWLDFNTDTLNERTKKYFKFAYETIFKKKAGNIDYMRKAKENIAMLSIRRDSKFGDLYLEELEYSHSDLVSDIGGLMGFWLGLSVVGLCEICEITYFLLLRFIVFLLRRRRPEESHVFNEPLNQLNTV